MCFVRRENDIRWLPDTHEKVRNVIITNLYRVDRISSIKHADKIYMYRRRFEISFLFITITKYLLLRQRLVRTLKSI